MRVISFNCDGISQAHKNGALEWLASQEADIICLQNIQENEAEFEDRYFIEGYYCYSYCAQETHMMAGVAFYMRKPPKAVIKSLGFSSFCTEGRFIQADFQNISIVNLFIPSLILGYDRDYKYKFLNSLSSQISKIKRKRRQFIICGSWDIPHKDIDAAPQAIESLHVHNTEQTWIDSMFKLGFFDAYRTVDPTSCNYTWWKSEELRNNDIGARVDYQVVTDEVNRSVLNAGIYSSKNFSTHAPVIVDYDLELN
jgi:exodeoxyribonuclease-3